jgi:hypothetical protein
MQLCTVIVYIGMFNTGSQSLPVWLLLLVSSQMPISFRPKAEQYPMMHAAFSLVEAKPCLPLHSV